MAAVMNGIALHGGFIPYGGTFLAFSDYARPAMRLSALMGLSVVHVMTHDSIGLGEDGPTHQPVEHLTALRPFPTSWYSARPTRSRPPRHGSARFSSRYALRLSLTRQTVPALRTEARTENLTVRGGYLIRNPGERRDVTLMATGSEVSIACDAAEALAADGMKAAVVSLPCFELFQRQERDYRRAVLGVAPRVAVEAAIRDSWDRFLREEDAFIGMEGFGASAPAPDLYRHFGITAEAIAATARRLVAAGPHPTPTKSTA